MRSTGVWATMVVVACGGGGTPPGGSGEDGGLAAGGRAEWQRCVHGPGGYDVAYPAGWHTNDGSVMPACSLFDPEPVFVPEGSEIPEDIAVGLHVEAVPFDSIVGSEYGMRLLSQESLELGGQRAVRRLYEHTGEGLYNSGLRTWQYVVDRGDGTTLIATSHDAGSPSFDEKRRVLDELMVALRRLRD
jgi:hypothetical protein